MQVEVKEQLSLYRCFKQLHQPKIIFCGEMMWSQELRQAVTATLELESYDGLPEAFIEMTIATVNELKYQE